MEMHEDLSALGKEELIARYMQVKNEVARYHNFQLAKKIQLNSAYGAL